MPRKRRLLHVLKSSDLGGIQKYTLALCQGLDRSRYDIEVATSGGGPLIAELERIDVPVHVVEIPRYRISPLADWRAMRRLAQLFRERRYDIVHPQGSKPGAIGRVAARKAGVPITVFTVHLVPFHPGVNALKRWIYRRIDTRLARHTDAIITCAKHHRETLLRLGVAREEQITVIQNGHPTPEAPPTPEQLRAAHERLGVETDRPIVAFIARLMPQKDPETYLRAVKICVDRGAPGRFILIGTGELLPRCERLARDLGLGPEQLLFLGERRDVPQILPAVGVFVLPSLWEGLPLTLLEALEACAPIVCTDIPGNDEVVEHGSNGLLVPPRDPEALASAITWLLENRDEASRFAEAGYQRLITDFTMDRMIRQTQEVYDRLWRERMGDT
ncbi:glycosyltransferase family 4 protein [Candidatus Sumerlaeota bacterium]|nr:glycosyltransferase family 4 protein [Candidatus Sumerlaeota bacterium]